MLLGYWLLGCGIVVYLASVWRQEGILTVAALLLVMPGLAMLHRARGRDQR